MHHHKGSIVTVAHLRTLGLSIKLFHFLETSLQRLMLFNGRYLKMSWKISSGNQNNDPFFINLVIRGTGSARSISSMGGVNVLPPNLSTKISVKFSFVKNGNG